jgi:hypothetical protein
MQQRKAPRDRVDFSSIATRDWITRLALGEGVLVFFSQSRGASRPRTLNMRALMGSALRPGHDYVAHPYRHHAGCGDRILRPRFRSSVRAIELSSGDYPVCKPLPRVGRMRGNDKEWADSSGANVLRRSRWKTHQSWSLARTRLSVSHQGTSKNSSRQVATNLTR